MVKQHDSVSMRRRLGAMLAVATFGTAACGGAQHGPGSVKQFDDGLVGGAGLPSAVLDAKTGRQVDDAAFWSRVEHAPVVCVGEEHPNPQHHWVQLQVIKHLVKASGKGEQLGVGFEMFQRPFQGVLDDYAAGRIDTAALLARSGWEDRWGYPFALYQPLVDMMRNAGGALLALNPSKELVKRVSHDGLEALTPEEKAQVPELNLDDAHHRAWFDAIMESMGGPSAHTTKAKEPEPAPAPMTPAPQPALPPGHPPVSGTPLPPGHPTTPGAPLPPGHPPIPPAPSGDAEPEEPAMPSMDRIYTVQVLWDETMADTAATWVKADPSRHIVIIAGNGHCHDSAIVARVRRRGVADVISIRPVVDDGGGEVSDLLAKPENDYLWVMTAPPSKPEDAAPSDGADANPDASR